METQIPSSKKTHWAKLNRERALAAHRAWRAANRDKERAYRRKWAAKNQEKLRALKSASYYRNIETARAYRKANVESLRSKRKKYGVTNASALKDAARKYRSENPEKVLAWHRSARVTRRAQYFLYNLRKNAKRAGVPFDLTNEWVQQRLDAGVCEMSGLIFAPKGEKLSPLSPSVDRYKAGEGYTQENCKMVVLFLNRAFSNLKKDIALDIFEALLRKQRPHLFGPGNG